MTRPPASMRAPQRALAGVWGESATPHARDARHMRDMCATGSATPCDTPNKKTGFGAEQPGDTRLT